MEKNNAPLQVEGLIKRYPSFTLDNLNFSLTPGAITGLIGRNGAGKTTTLNAILSFIRPDAGTARFFGIDMRDHADAVKARLGFVSAGMTYYTRKKLRLIANVTRSFYPQWDECAYQSYMRRFGLEENKTPAQLSNGMKIKFALALALSHRAELLILDEPTSGLDPVSREELTEIFLRLRDEGKTVLFSTHITSDLEKCADRILYIRRGVLAADMPLDEFADAYRLRECAGAVPPDIQQKALGRCRVRDGYTVLLSRDDAGADDRKPTLEEIMTHMDREGGDEA